jgi:hypothetical protein
MSKTWWDWFRVDMQKKIGVQFLKVFRDLPFLLCGVVVTLLLWRAPFLWYDIYRVS